MRRLGVVPVPQPTQVHLYGEGVRNDHPDLADRMYPSGLIADAGLPVVLSSDAPVTNPDVLLACWAAETRITPMPCAVMTWAHSRRAAWPTWQSWTPTRSASPPTASRTYR